MYSIFLQDTVANVLDAGSKSILVITVGTAHSSLNENQVTWKEEENLWSAEHPDEVLMSQEAPHLQLMDFKWGKTIWNFIVWGFKLVFS